MSHYLEVETRRSGLNDGGLQLVASLG